MTDTTLRALLDDAAGEPPVRLDGPAVRARATSSPRRSSRLLPLVAAAAVTVLAVAVPQLVSRDDKSNGTAALPEGAVRFNGVAVVLPDGWSTGKSLCGQQRSRTVALEPGPNFMSCPDLPAAYAGTWLTLRPVHLDQLAYTWTGERTTWQGQPAFRAVRAGNGGVLVTVTLPALNAQLSAAAPDETQADDVLKAVTPAPQPAIDPADWTTVHVLALQDTKGDKRTRTAATLSGQEASDLLAIIASAPASDADICQADWDAGTVLLRLEGPTGEHRDLAVRTDAPCAQVFTGGQLRTVTPRLLELLDSALTDPATAPPAVAAAAANLRSTAPGGTRIIWVRTTWGRWRTLEGQSLAPPRQQTSTSCRAPAPWPTTAPAAKASEGPSVA